MQLFDFRGVPHHSFKSEYISSLSRIICYFFGVCTYLVLAINLFTIDYIFGWLFQKILHSYVLHMKTGPFVSEMTVTF